MTILKQALVALEKMQARLEEIEQRQQEPIAIIGVGCRLPGGVDSPAAFWQLLCEEKDVITEVPGERWDINAFYAADPGMPGKMCSRRGAFLRDVDKFDPYFFGISPREAIGMDPQQRLFLEVAWEALEDAGQVREQLHNSQTGVFVGIMSKEYINYYKQKPDLSLIDAYYCTGNDFSFAAGRLSYILGLQGPSIAIDTACSSSLVAVHLACQSLRSGECQMALAGGVSLILAPELTIFLSRAGALAPDGRSKAFSDAADGMGRGEGCGVVVLKRLSTAVADGDRILALIRGSAVNHSGHSAGFTVPNGLAQQALLRQALANARLEPLQVQYVEAHGTGTILGDPIEIEALSAVLGEGRAPDRPLVVASVKANIGHLDPAAGVTGLIKSVLMLQHQEIPRQMHVEKLNTRIPWQQLPLAIPMERSHWTSHGEPRVAGVSAFGMSGVNAHVLVQEALLQQKGTPVTDPERPYLLPLSSHSQESLATLVQSYLHFLREEVTADEDLPDICYTAGVRRTHHDFRVAVAGRSRAELAAQLDNLGKDETHQNLLIAGNRNGKRQKLAFVFSGQGAQWVGMGRRFLGQSSVFRQVIERCDELFQSYARWSLVEELTATEPRSRLDRTEVTQPLVFAIEVALATVWRSWGIQPDAVIGHSMGEIAAASIAGILSLEDAVRIVYHRGRVMQRVTGQGRMVLVQLPASQVEQVIAPYADILSIAAINSPAATVVSGSPSSLDMLVQDFQLQGIACQFLRGHYAFHSPQMEPLQHEFMHVLQHITPHESTIPFVSTVTGQFCPGEHLTAHYWARNMREPVLFAGALETLIQDDHGLFIEVGPHPVLLQDIRNCLHSLNRRGLLIPSLRRKQEEYITLFNSLGELYCHGYPFDWNNLYPSGGNCTTLPVYAWQRERLWITDQESFAHHQPLPLAQTLQPSQGMQPPLLEHAVSEKQGSVRSYLDRELLLQADPQEQQELLHMYLQRQICRILKLATHKFKASLSLHQLGIDSLTALELKNSVETDLAVQLPLITLLQGSSTEELGEFLHHQMLTGPLPLAKAKEAFSAQVEGLPHVVSQAVLPLSSREPLLPSSGQQRLWFLDQLYPNEALYNEYMCMRLRGTVHLDALEQSINTIVQRHETLRTVFPCIDGQVLQQIEPWRPIQIERQDLRELPLHLREEQAIAQAERMVRQKLSLQQGPLMKVFLYQLDEQDALLLILMHHITIDAWSAGVFYRELAELYAGYCQGIPVTLPDLPVQYADFCAWQRQWLQGETLTLLQDYWKSTLAGANTRLELPADHPRPAVQSTCGAHARFLIPLEVAQSIKAFSAESNVTLFMLLLSAFMVLLHRYTGQDDILIGTPVANRPDAQLQKLIGFFINTIALRADLSHNPTFHELLHHVRDLALEAFEHQDMPFEHVVSLIEPRRDASRSPLFQYLFVLEKESWSEAQLNELTLSPVEIESGCAIYDLVLSLVDSGKGLQGSLEYNTDLFERRTIERLIGHFTALLKESVSNPAKSINQLEILTASERLHILHVWNDTGVDREPGTCLHQLFEQQATLVPEAIAVVFEESSLTYRELNDQANQLAHCLLAQEIGPDVLVGICMERSLDLVVALLAVLKAGGAFVPLDPDYPSERLAFMLEDAQCPVVLTQTHVRARLSATAVKTICITAGRSPSHLGCTENPTSRIQPENLAYMIYTSGSTGKPKGAMNTHRGICNRLFWMQEAYNITPGDRVIQKTPLSFDVSVWEFFWPLLAGARLIMARPAGHRDPIYLSRLMAEQQVTTLHFVPSMLQAFLSGHPHLEDCTGLRHVICSGEALSSELQASFFAHVAGDVALHNLYGPTEAAIDVTAWLCQRRDADEAYPYACGIPIGRPIANTQIYLLDKNLAPVPIGVTGELYIGGVGLARGYWQRPDLTAEKFVPNPFVGLLQGSAPEARLYRTGDLARYRVDGAIEYLGRLDHQVKIRGFRIELGEIEACLVRHPALQECVVLVAEPVPGDKRLIAYLVATCQPAPSVSELRQWLGEHLPLYMIPTAFIYLAALPLTPNGKLDRKALPAVDQQRPQLEAHYIAPSTEAERSITQIWQRVLHIDQVGTADHFFELGGNSLLMVEVHHRLCAAIGHDISLITLLRYPTIQSLADFIGQEQAQAGASQEGQARASTRTARIQHRQRSRQEAGQGRRSSKEGGDSNAHGYYSFNRPA